MFVCGFDRPEFPEVGDGTCCMGAAVYGPGACTCWTAEFDLDQRDPVLSDRGLRGAMCSDCAFRPDSPERRGDPSHAGDEDYLMGLVESGEVFVCHQGIRRPVAWHHPSGATVPGNPADYRPPIHDSILYKADGTPADICAGWAALRLKAVARAR